jgi:hypothetical protein
MLLSLPTATSALGSALHTILRNVLRTAAFPILALATPGGAATFYAPAFGRVWWLALGWSLAEVTAGVVQGYETIALYRDVLVPEGGARELIATSTFKNGGCDRASSRLRESLGRGEDGGPAVEATESPVGSREQQQLLQQESYRSSMAVSSEASDAEIRLEVDKDFDDLLALKAREELEELYGFPAIVSCSLFFLTCPSTYLKIVVRACVCVLLVAHRIDITFPRHCLALVGRIPYLATRLAPNCRVRRDDDHSAFIVQLYFLGYFFRRLWGQLGLIDASYACALTTCWSARSGVPRIPGRVRNVIHGFERLGCIVVK